MRIRPATLLDVPDVERVCWRGGEDEKRRRIRAQGTCSILALDGERIIALLRGAVGWLESGAAPFDALAAKATDSEDRAYIGWVGGLPLTRFTELGFERLASFDDPYLVERPELRPETAVAEQPARFHLVIRRRG